MSTAAMTPAGYIRDHLNNLNFNLKSLSFGGPSNFWTVHVDTLGVSFVLGAVFVCLFWFVASRATSSTPGRLQNAIEFIYEWIESICNENFSRPMGFVAPLAMTIFMWVFLMNFMDLVPLDLLPRTMELFGLHAFRSVPTADPYTTFALSIGVFITLVFHNLKYKGIRGFTKEILSTPFGWYLLPFNLFFHAVESFVKIFSLSLRLFGNLFAGEMIFILIAALIPWYLGWMPGVLWSGLHMLIISIQAFIFMFLSVMYLNMAVEMEH